MQLKECAQSKGKRKQYRIKLQKQQKAEYADKIDKTNKNLTLQQKKNVQEINNRMLTEAIVDQISKDL